MGLCYDTGSWADSKWGSHVKASNLAKSVIRTGTEKQDDFSKFAEDVHARLYLRNEPDKVDGDAPDWASKIHNEASDMKEWQQLRRRCQGNGFSSAMATEQFLSMVLSNVPQQSKGNNKNNSQGTLLGGTGVGGDTPGKAKGSQGKGSEGDPDGSVVRKVIRRAVREAKIAADEAVETVGSLNDIFGLPGSEPGQPETMKDLQEVRKLYESVRNNHKLKSIAKLAGRIRRISDTKKRTKVREGVGAVKGITMGGDVSRVIPSELAGMRSKNRLMRLETIRRIIERRALCLEMKSEQPKGRGPIVVCMDESSSMQGDRDTWSKAVALTLLSVATQQNRDWCVIGYSGSINHQTMIAAGKADINAVSLALSKGCHGGTDFNAPINAALNVIDESSNLKEADIIFITDGEGSVNEDTANRLNAYKNDEGLSFYVVGIGNKGELSRSLGAIATTIINVNSVTGDFDDIHQAINL